MSQNAHLTLEGNKKIPDDGPPLPWSGLFLPHPALPPLCSPQEAWTVFLAFAWPAAAVGQWEYSFFVSLKSDRNGEEIKQQRLFVSASLQLPHDEGSQLRRVKMKTWEARRRGKANKHPFKNKFECSLTINSQHGIRLTPHRSRDEAPKKEQVHLLIASESFQSSLLVGCRTSWAFQ